MLHHLQYAHHPLVHLRSSFRDGFIYLHQQHALHHHQCRTAFFKTAWVKSYRQGESRELHSRGSHTPHSLGIKYCCLTFI
jgi:hypothetical protein